MRRLLHTTHMWVWAFAFMRERALSAHCLGGANRVITQCVCWTACVCVCICSTTAAPESEVLNYTRQSGLFFWPLSVYLCVWPSNTEQAGQPIHAIMRAHRVRCELASNCAKHTATIFTTIATLREILKARPECIMHDAIEHADVHAAQIVSSAVIWVIYMGTCARICTNTMHLFSTG